MRTAGVSKSLTRAAHRSRVRLHCPLGLSRQAKIHLHPLQQLSVVTHGALLLGQALNLFAPALLKECTFFSLHATPNRNHCAASIRRRRFAFNSSFHGTKTRALRGFCPVNSYR